ncbi:MAG: caspase family protein [Archangium sp.]|nr:caspase family protein [Archangium sp.]
MNRIGLLAVFVLHTAAAAATPPAVKAAGCTQAAVAVGGHRTLALVVGVGMFKSPEVHALAGPTNDVDNMVELLRRRYQVPKENLCVLKDAEATVAAFKATFDKALVERAQAGDVAIVYFSGHGSQTTDLNRDEEDGLDETWLLHDSRLGTVTDLVDDDVEAMLAKLYAKTKNVTVILDSCNSGSATRGLYTPRSEQPVGKPAGSALSAALGSTKPPMKTTLSMPGLVVLSAASDGTVALETGGRGIFTDALLQVLGQSPRDPLLYSQAARQVMPIVSARSYQLPSFQGDLTREVFGDTSIPRPLSWEVKTAGATLKLEGPPVPGMGINAELRIYDPNLKRGDFNDPELALGVATITKFVGLRADARFALKTGKRAPKNGDLAVLARPGDQSLVLNVRLRPAAEPGGLTKAVDVALRKAITTDAEASKVITLTDGKDPDFEVATAADGSLLLIGPERLVRNREPVANAAALPTHLWHHARQKALKLLVAEPGTTFNADDLSVELVPVADQNDCGKKHRPAWVAPATNQPQIVPLCVVYNVKATLSDKAKQSVLVGGVMLSTDGSTTGFPIDGSKRKLKPGESTIFSERFQGNRPIDVVDMVRVFGTLETNPMPWYLLTVDTATRDAKKGTPEAAGGLYQAVSRYLVPGQRGSPLVGVNSTDESPWIAATLGHRTEVNPRFEETKGAGAPASKEYTINDFDVRGYLPDDAESAVYKVLKLESDLMKRTIPYKQHNGWDDTKKTDDDNLKTGIDCSRAIWFAFTRSNLPYNKTNKFLATADMVDVKSPMADEFDRCDSSPALQVGDVLVYRDQGQGDGHVVMVIDPGKRIAWGSHGWDGTSKAGQPQQRGVQYQLIKYTTDWERWDRKNMLQVACWRYRKFTEEATSLRAVPGVTALGDNPCDNTHCN